MPKLKLHVADIRALLDDVPPKDQPEDPAVFWKAVAGELSMLIEYAARAEEPEVVLWPMMKTGEQYLWEFYVNDLSKPKTESHNWHGQNVSQWLYAGAIALQNKRVSTHH